MTSNDAPGRPASAVTALAVLAALVGALGVVASLATTNGLLTGSTWQVPALISIGVVVVTFALIVIAGGPSSNWRRTPYW
jgi:hypothetical protein